MVKSYTQQQNLSESYDSIQLFTAAGLIYILVQLLF